MRNFEKDKFIQLGKNIQKLRRKYNLSTEELSNKSEIRHKYLKQIESGTAYGVALSHIKKIANSFKINVSEVLKGL